MDRKTAGFVAILCLLGITSIFSFNVFMQQRISQDRVDISAFPYKVGVWEGQDIPLEEYVYKILETRNLVLRKYTNPSNGDILTLFIVYSETNRSVFHPPEVCLIGSGIKIVDKKSERITYNDRTFISNKLYTEKSGHRQVTLYCYKANRFHTDNYYLQQAYFAFGQLLKKYVKGATIRVSMAVGDSNEEEVVAKLRDFMAESAKIIDAL